jgi:hypothetical protein
MKSFLSSLGFFLLVLISLLPVSAWSAKGPLSEGTSAGAKETMEKTPESNSDLVVRFGNESNQPDGAFGPLTYGLRGSHTFPQGLVLEAGYIRLHELGTHAFSSFLDEAQVTLRLPERPLLSQSVVLGVTLWKNRMIDMYTNLAGVEISGTGRVVPGLGLYVGTASRNEFSEHFYGLQLSLAGSLGPFEFSAGHLNGRINQGLYRKTALQAAWKLPLFSRLPMTLTLGFEDRYFKFGIFGPVSDANDERILISGLEMHWGALWPSLI